MVNRVIVVGAAMFAFALLPGSRLIVAALVVLFAIDTFFKIKRIRRMRVEDDRKG